jgi:hypothetical protein
VAIAENIISPGSIAKDDLVANRIRVLNIPPLVA